MLNHELHPNWYKDVPVMNTLILGSFPPHINKHDYPFYYPNAQNRFWKILAQLSRTELHYLKKLNDTDKHKAIAERYAIMKKLNCGIQNMGASINRKNKSSLDTDIEIMTYQDILSIIKKHPELKRILLPGFSARSSTYNSFVNYLIQHKISFAPLKKPSAGAKFTVTFFENEIECIVLNSTSTAARIDYDTVLQQFKNAIYW